MKSLYHWRHEKRNQWRNTTSVDAKLLNLEDLSLDAIYDDLDVLKTIYHSKYLKSQACYKRIFIYLMIWYIPDL